jgi:hypothetical protein
LRPTAWRSSSGELPVVEIIISGIVADLALGLSEYSRLSRLKLRC